MASSAVAYLPAEERRRSIVDAAVVVIASHGLAGATTRRIAEQAKAPLGSLHYCFHNKPELIDVVAERGATMLREAFDDVDPGRGLEPTIRDSVTAYWRWVQANLGLQLALLELGMWRIRQAADGESVYSMYDAFGTDLLKRKLDLAVAAEKAEPRRCSPSPGAGRRGARPAVMLVPVIAAPIAPPMVRMLAFMPLAAPVREAVTPHASRDRGEDRGR